MKPSFYRSQARHGFALVLTLCAVVLLTLLILTFFSGANIARKISYSNTSTLKAEFLTRSALDVITGEMRNEIADPTRSVVSTVNGVAVYRPVSYASLLPAQLGLSLPSGVLLRVSAANTPIRPGGTILASATRIDVPSLNGRYISPANWFTSNTSSPQLGSNGTMPTWLMVTRGNGIKTPVLADAQNAGSADCVVGRFAYSIYDLGGLQDANVAGHPTGAGFASTYVPFKGSPAYADLTPLGINPGNFLDWRNATTGSDAETFQEWAVGTSRPAAQGSPLASALSVGRAGHLMIAAGDNAVLSRHDLLNNSNLTGAAPLMTHFSRSLSVPSWSPQADTLIPYKSNADAAASINRNLPNVRFAKAGTVTHYADDGTKTSCSVIAGDPLLQRRFSLAKLAWLTYKGPSAALSTSDSLYNAGGTSEAILACFGLQWDTTSQWWLYAQADATYHIKTLDKIASEPVPREPNFFELLNAGILSGSVGKAGTAALPLSSQQNILDANSDLQILRIGANILNCARPDNYPATIALNVGGVNVPVYGVTDLPYMWGLLAGGVWESQLVSAAAKTNQLNWATLFLAPLLYNPHKSGVPATATPARIRVRIATGTFMKVINPADTAAADRINQSPNRDLSDNSPITIPQTQFETFQPFPSVIKGTGATTLGSLLTPPNTIDSAHAGIQAFIAYAYPSTAVPTQYSYASANASFRVTMNNVYTVLEYQDYQSNWRIYDSLAGNEAFQATGTGIGSSNVVVDWGPAVQAATGAGGVTTITRNNPDTTVNNGLSAFLGKFDPRSSRFGISRSVALSTQSANPLIYESTTTSTGSPINGALQYQLAFGSAAAGTTSIASWIYPGTWVQGDKTGWVESNYAAGPGARYSTIGNIADPDGVIRPADAWIGGTNSTLTASPGNYLHTTGTAGARLRPVILHRPFRSVAELGYVFRDSPWKTLSFFDDTSADSALLDIFSVADDPVVVAGRPNLNAAQPLLLETLLTGAGQASDGTSALPNPAGIASAYQNFAFASGTPAAAIPTNPGQLVNFTTSTPLAGAYPTSANYIKNARESIVRSLAGNTQTRTWNLLIDVVAQTGRYPSTATSLDNFLVEGEKRYWLSIAIDRFTGKVISEQLEAAE